MANPTPPEGSLLGGDNGDGGDGDHDADHDGEGATGVGLAAALLRERRLGRGERRLLERLVALGEEHAEYLRQRLEAAQRQATTLRSALSECRSQLLQRRRQHSQLLVENTRLRGDNCLLRSFIIQGSAYSFVSGEHCRIQYMDTAL